MTSKFQHYIDAPLFGPSLRIHDALRTANVPMQALWGLWGAWRRRIGQPIGQNTRDPALCKIDAMRKTLALAVMEADLTETEAATFIHDALTAPVYRDAFRAAMTGTTPTPAPTPEPPPMTETTATPVKVQQAAAALADAIAAIRASGVDAAQVQAIVDDRLRDAAPRIAEAVGASLDGRIKSAIDAAIIPTRVTFQPAPDAPPVDLGVCHKAMPTLLRWFNTRDRDDFPLNIWLYGPPGTGKTSAARKAAEALGVPFYTVSAVDGKHEFVGFTDAMGRIVNTAFRKAWRDGGLFLADELDASFASAVMALNSALANGIITFPGDEEPTPRHPKFYCAVGANSKGLGGDINTNTSNRFAFSTLDRFVFLEWGTDEAFEFALSRHKGWCRRVQAARKWLAGSSIKGVQITPRSTFKGEALLAVTPDDVALIDRATWAFALSDDQYRNACNALPTFNIKEAA